MASLENLPPDQRAVLQMVLARGRGYNEIAKMLKIDRADVRQRALQAMDAIGAGPIQSRVPAERRALIADYLLGQLSGQASEEVREQLARSPSDRAWARVVASELQSLTDELPEIPTAAPDGDGGGSSARAGEREAPVAAAGAARESEAAASEGPGPRAFQPPSSRRGGAILLGLVAAVVIAVVVVLIATSGGSSHKSNTTASRNTGSTTPASTTTSAQTCNPATSTTACPVAQINLTSPTGSKSTIGIAEVLKKGSSTAIAIVAQGVPANTKHDAYAVWLANSPSDTHAVRLGFVNPGVTSNGKLQTAGALPAKAANYKQLLITRETKPNPPQPGTVVLQGQFTEG
jgi:hypothetical protein